ncbi:MAG: type II toxin-antitoxin system prevent-host-death family antitoxin [Candidatus Kaiserbacteria bacterium]|jgi:prevent-host-death family protein|nr:type II toxin-antitoxin system prevent-host-death family antitoxin [Candidatus Kaiserbacteria bacterium]
MNTKLKTVGLKELRENMEKYISRVDKGESITVLRRNEPIFRLTPVDEEEMGWETVIDFTEINPRGVSGKEILKRLKKING